MTGKTPEENEKCSQFTKAKNMLLNELISEMHNVKKQNILIATHSVK